MVYRWCHFLPVLRARSPRNISVYLISVQISRSPSAHQVVWFITSTTHTTNCSPNPAHPAPNHKADRVGVDYFRHNFFLSRRKKSVRSASSRGRRDAFHRTRETSPRTCGKKSNALITILSLDTPREPAEFQKLFFSGSAIFGRKDVGNGPGTGSLRSSQRLLTIERH